MLSFKKIVYVFFEILLLIISYLVLYDINDFRKGCIIGTILILLNFVIYLFYQKKIFNVGNVMAISFVLFQFGIPILYAIDSNYTNWYISRFSDINLITSLRYTVVCVEFFLLGLIISYSEYPKNKRTKKMVKYSFLNDENSKTIYLVSKILFILTGIVAFPLAIYVAYLALLYGYNYIKMDSMGIYNGITRICQELIVPSLLLLIIYAPNNKNKRIYKIIAMTYAFLLIFTGARTTSLSLILVLLLMENIEDKKKMNFKNKIFVVVASFILLFIGTFIAQYRYNGKIKTFSITNTVESVVEEMGFNFTSLPFTKIFIPSSENIKYGLSYIASLLFLIPRTIDFTGTIDKIYNILPELWLANNLHLRFGSLYDFGVGYSVIAESFYNFGNYGFFIILFQGIIVGKLLNISIDTKFKKYVKHIMLFCLITYPRRSFLTLLKSLEYCVVLIIILIWLASYKKNNNIEKR